MGSNKMTQNMDRDLRAGLTSADALEHSNAAPINRFNRTFTATVLACATLYMQQNHPKGSAASEHGAHYQTLEQFLRIALTMEAGLLATSFSGWTADIGNPGYLIRQVPPSFFRVPVHLVAVFPDDEALGQIWILANRIRTDQDAIIFISGSNAVRSVLEYVNDVDFCEYLPKAGEEAEKAVWLKLRNLSADDVCVRLRVGAERWAVPLPEEEVSHSLRATSYSAPELSTAKIDYISRNVGTRVMDVSNVLILCSKEFKSAGFVKTYPFQEAQVSAVDYVPNPLANALELGRYVCDLLRETKKYKDDGDHAKALKRALSLTRVAWMNNFTDKIKRILDHSTILVDAEISTCEGIRQSLHQYCPTWVDEIAELERHLAVKKSERETFSLKERQQFPNGAASAAEKLLSGILSAVDAESGGALQ